MRKLMRSLREERKLTQKQVAEQLDISRAHYGKIEVGNRNPTLKIAFRIKNFFGYKEDDIFFDDECGEMANRTLEIKVS